MTNPRQFIRADLDRITSAEFDAMTLEDKGAYMRFMLHCWAENYRRECAADDAADLAPVDSRRAFEHGE